MPRVSWTQEKREGCCNCSRKLSEGTEWTCVLVGGGTNHNIEYLLMLIDNTCEDHPETIARNRFRSIWSYVLKGGYQIHCFVDATEHTLFICLQREWLAGLRNCILVGARSSFDFCEMHIACVYDWHDRFRYRHAK